MNTQKPYAKLLEESFPGINSTINRCQALGFSWANLSGRAFVKEQDGNIVSHVAVLACQVLIEKKWCKVTALHAVCTKKGHGGQGLASSLIHESLEWAKKHSDFQILFTEIPDSLAIKTKAEPYLYDKGQLMVHGEFSYQEPFMIAPLSRC